MLAANSLGDKQVTSKSPSSTSHIYEAIFHYHLFVVFIYLNWFDTLELVLCMIIFLYSC
jgi:hypothetical protein